jgi:hypothetical protein
MGINWYIVVNPSYGLRLTAHTGVVTRVGYDSDTVSLAVLRRWE